jgi:hypothetical protein
MTGTNTPIPPAPQGQPIMIIPTFLCLGAVLLGMWMMISDAHGAWEYVLGLVCFVAGFWGFGHFLIKMIREPREPRRDTSDDE